MPKFRVTITRVYEADFEAEDAEEAKRQIIDLPVSMFLIVGDDVEIAELTVKSERKVA